MTVDTRPARDVLTVLAAGPDSPAALGRLKGSRAVLLAFARAPGGPEGFFGRLAAAAAGRPDAVAKGIIEGQKGLRAALDALEADGPDGGKVEAARLASLLPATPKVEARFVVVPVFGMASFAEVTTIRDGDTTWLLADVPRLIGGPRSALLDRELTLKVLRAAATEAWRVLFERSLRPRPGWAPRGGEGKELEAFLDRTVSEGPSTLFLVPDEFYPLALLEEPIGRAFSRWNEAAEALLDPKVKPQQKETILSGSISGDDFWGRYAAIVGAQAADSILRLAGREAWAAALAEGPRAVLSLYVKLSSPKASGLPQLGKRVRRALDAGPKGAPPPGPAAPAPSSVNGQAGAEAR